MTIGQIGTQILATLTLLSHVFLLVVLADFLFTKLFHKKIKTLQTGKKLLVRYGKTLAFIVAVTATVGSLFFSEVALFEPCKLCWFQRIAMYPQVVILYLLKNTYDFLLKKASIILSSIGGIIATYHYYLQVSQTESFLPCSAIGYSVSCSDRFVMNYGYITIPMMSFIAFTLITLMLWIKLGSKK